MTWRCAGLLVLSLLALAMPAMAASTVVPKPFRGRWNPTLAACTQGEPLDEIRIDGKGLFFWEASQQQITILAQSPGLVRLRASQYESEADDPNKPSGKEMVELKLLAGGRRLRYQVDGGRYWFYVRCTGTRPEQRY